MIRRDSPRVVTTGTEWKMGFSLIEVVLALGLVAFALVAILGLVVSVMKTSKENKRSTENCMLFKEVVNQLRIKPFAASQAGNKMTFPLPPLNVPKGRTEFFVDSKNEFVGLASATLPKDAVHAIVVVVLNAQDLEIEGVKAPPSVSDGRLALVRVEIAPASTFNADAKIQKGVYVTEVAALDQ